MATEQPFMTAEERARPCEHDTSLGSRFRCDRMDLGPAVWCYIDKELSDDDVAQQIAEFTAYWTLHVYPRLNGFPGFDTLRFIVKRV